MNLLQFSNVTSVQHPIFLTHTEVCRFVNCKICLQSYAVVIPHALRQSAKRLTGFGNA